MKKRYLLAFLMICCLLCNLLGVQWTGAWFVSGGTLGNATYDTAKVLYLPGLEPTPEEKSVYGTLTEGSTQDTMVALIPGEEILSIPEGTATPQFLSLENFSTTPTEVRLKMALSFTNNPEMDGKMEWKETSTPNVYQFGSKTDLYKGDTLVASDVFMPLLEVTLSQKAVKDTVIPNGVAPTTPFGESTYQWKRATTAITGTEPEGQILFPEYWQLLLNDSATIPPLSTERQFYNVVESIRIIGAVDAYQAEFDNYFSEHYAGYEVYLKIEYFAKQQPYMEWNMFSETDLKVSIGI